MVVDRFGVREIVHECPSQCHEGSTSFIRTPEKIVNVWEVKWNRQRRVKRGRMLFVAMLFGDQSQSDDEWTAGLLFLM
jgi:hypothetical protein